MIQYLVRFAKRLAVLLPALGIAAVSVLNIYPFLNKGVNGVVAFLATYVLAAYILIPAASRLVQAFIRQPGHLPVYSVTPDGYASDPLNIGIIGTHNELIYAMRRAGWEVADDHILSNMWKEVVCTILRVPYPAAPMSNLYLFGRKQDIGFEIRSADKQWHRHHVRFWATTYNKSNGQLKPKSIHWFPRKEQQLHRDQKLLWLGAASKDIGLALIKHNAQLTHMIHPDTDAERDLIVEQLQIEGAELTADLTIMEPYKLVNRAWSGYLQTDGRLKVVSLPDSSTQKKKS